MGDDPVRILIAEADEKSSVGDYIGALNTAQKALEVAKEVNEDDEKYSLRIAYAKLQRPPKILCKSE